MFYTDPAISEYEKNLKEVYTHVRTWNDLLKTNIDFLEGRQKSAFYYIKPFHDEFYHDGVYKIEGDLVRLHKEYGVFTYDSQDNYVSPFNIRKRGYLSFVCDKNPMLVERLLGDHRIYTFVKEENPDGSYSIVHNCPDQITLTEPYGAIFNLKDCEDSDNDLMIVSEELPYIRALLSDALHVFIAIKEFPAKGKKPLQATTCLLDVLEGRQ